MDSPSSLESPPAQGSGLTPPTQSELEELDREILAYLDFWDIIGRIPVPQSQGHIKGWMKYF